METITNITINIGKDFNPLLGGRFKHLGPYSGEEFYDKLLKDKYEEALFRGISLIIEMDDVKQTYPSSFIDQSFGELGRNYEKEDVKERVKLITSKFYLIKDAIEKLWI